MTDASTLAATTTTETTEGSGHSQIALTANTYAHLMDELRESSAVRADAALAAARASVKRPAAP